MPLPLRYAGVFIPLVLALPLCLPSPAEGQYSDTAKPRIRATDGRPIARIKKSMICCPREKVELDGWASIDVGGEVAVWMWDLNEDGRTDTMCMTGDLTIRSPSRSHTYQVILRVQDKEGNISDPDTGMVFVQDLAPSVSVRPDTTVKIGVRVRFEPRVSAVCNQVVRYEWDLDDDGKYEYHSSSDGTTSKEFHTPGRYTTRFRVFDSTGREAGAVSVVNVTDRSGVMPPLPAAVVPSDESVQ